jgi:hypothetical protein
MNNLPKVLEDIILNYKHQLDFSECLNEINEIEYEAEPEDWEGCVISTRTYKNKEIVMYFSSYDWGLFMGLFISIGENLTITFTENETGKIEIEYNDKTEENLRQKWKYKYDSCLSEIKYDVKHNIINGCSSLDGGIGITQYYNKDNVLHHKNEDYKGSIKHLKDRIICEENEIEEEEIIILPEDIKDIIFSYKHQLDFSECVKKE